MCAQAVTFAHTLKTENNRERRLHLNSAQLNVSTSTKTTFAISTMLCEAGSPQQFPPYSVFHSTLTSFIPVLRRRADDLWYCRHVSRSSQSCKANAKSICGFVPCHVLQVPRPCSSMNSTSGPCVSRSCAEPAPVSTAFHTKSQPFLPGPRCCRCPTALPREICCARKFILLMVYLCSCAAGVDIASHLGPPAKHVVCPAQSL